MGFRDGLSGLDWGDRLRFAPDRYTPVSPLRAEPQLSTHMALILFFTVLAIVALGAAFLLTLPAAGRGALVILAFSLVGFGLVVGSSVVIDEDEVGIVHKQFFGDPLPTGQIIARAGEMGPQAEILGPGWHFGFYPFTYQVRIDRVISVPSGQVGFVTARDGQPLPENSRLHDTADFAPPVDEERLYRVIDAMDEVAEETGKTIPQIALNWLLQRPTVSTVLIGARNEEQLRQNLGAVGWNLSSEQMAKLDAASAVTPPYPYYPYWRGQFSERNPPPVASGVSS